MEARIAVVRGRSHKARDASEGAGLLKRVLAAALAPALLAAAAFAEPKPVEPYHVVVNDKAALVCMPNDSAYTVAEVKAGTVLRVDADDARWARVEYPAGAKAFVRVDDGKVENGKLTLVNATKLFALNQVKGGSGSWKAVFDVELPAGTVLTLGEPATEKQGELVIGYNVIAPAGAKGFVESKGVRRASQAEVDTAKAGGALSSASAIAPSGGGVTPTGVEPRAEAAPKPTTNVAKAPVSTLAAATPAASTPAANAAPTEAGAISAAPGAGDAQVATSAAPAQRRIGDLKELEAAFQEVVKQPVMTAEFGELVVEFERAIAAVPADKPAFKKQLQARLDYLNLRKEYQASILAIEEARTKGDADMQQKLKDAIADVERSRVYTIIGTLQPSTVYDGVRLPRMYRVQSVGDFNARTLGYITPQDDLDLDGKIGQVVGIVGQAQMDPNLRLNVIAPVRVDLLKAGETKFLAPAQPVDKDAPSANAGVTGGAGPELNK